MMRRMCALLLVGLFVLSASVTAQDEEKKIVVGAEDGGPMTKIPAGFRAFVVVDDRFDVKDSRNRTGKFHCFVCEHGLAPGVAVFVRTVPKAVADEPLFKLLTSLDDAAVKYRPERLGVYCIFLTLDKLYEDDLMRELKVAEVNGIGKEAKLAQVPFAIAEASTPVMDKAVIAPQVKAFQIAETDDVTVIFYNRFNVLNRWTFTKEKGITDADVTAIRGEVDKLLAPKPRVPRVKKTP